MITSLTPEQEALLPAYKQQWTDIGLCTLPANRKEAVAALKTCYELAGLTLPPRIAWVDSPTAGATLSALIQDASAFDNTQKIYNKTSPGVLPGPLFNNLVPGLAKGFLEFLNLETTPSNIRRMTVAVNSVLPSVKIDRSLVNDAMYGQLEAYFLSFYAYAREVLGLTTETEKLAGLIELAKHCGWVYPYEEAAIMCERPEVLAVQNERLHSETGPAVKYRDGVSIYALNGIVVPAWVIETPRDEIDPAKVLAIANTEERAVIMRFIGLHRFLTALKAKELDSYEEYKLYTIEVEGTRVGPYLYMQCPSTGRQFLEGCGDAEKYENIDPTIKTCQDALKWRMMKASQNLMTRFLDFKKWNMHA